MALISIGFDNSFYAIRQLDPHVQKKPQTQSHHRLYPGYSSGPGYTPAIQNTQTQSCKLSGVLRSGSVIAIEIGSGSGIDRNDP